MAEILIGAVNVELTRPFPADLSRGLFARAYVEAFYLAQQQHEALDNPEVTADFLFMREVLGAFKREVRTTDPQHAIMHADYDDVVTTPAGEFYKPRSARTGIPLYSGPIPAIYNRAILGVQVSETDETKARTKIEELSLRRDLFIAHSEPFQDFLDYIRSRGLQNLKESTAYAFYEHGKFTPDPSGRESLPDRHMREAIARVEGPALLFTKSLC